MEAEMPSLCNGSNKHIWVIPFPACGHILPLIDLTHHLLLRGLTVTIVVTPKNLHYLNPLLSLHSPANVKPLVFPFPSHPSLPPDFEQMQDLPISYVPDVATATASLFDPLFQWHQSHPSPPAAILSDMLFSCWTTKLASHLDIPNISFIPFNANAVCSWYEKLMNDVPSFYKEVFTACTQSRALVFNSFKELEGEKFDVIKEKFAQHDRIWGVGPLLPVKAASDEGFKQRGGRSSMPPDEVMGWLDEVNADNSVVYVGFGTQITLTKQQMKAVASALEESGVRFIWAVKDPMNKAEEGDDDQSMIPEDFEDRTAGRGLVIKGWAPQVAILRHRAVGSYLTHCGWNSALESILAGVLLLAWPMQADHFYITKLLADERGVAIRVCSGLRSIPESAKLVQILVESTSNMALPERLRAMELQKTALNAIGEGGSSYQALDELIDEFSSLGCEKN